ncbi:MAG: putative spermidine/putrescine transport system permease protein, partial [Paracoccaceae bacterium]
MAETHTDANGLVLAADGTPLKQSLNRALRAQKIRALLLIAPLLLFILISFVLPIGEMLLRSVQNKAGTSYVPDLIPNVVVTLEDW